MDINVKYHRVAECPDCQETNWLSIRSEILTAIDKSLYAEVLTPDEHKHMNSFINECTDDELSTILQIVAAGLGGARDIAESISIAAQSFSDVVMNMIVRSKAQRSRTND